MYSKINKRLTVLFSCVLFWSCIIAQVDDFRFKRNLDSISESWHRVNIPDELFKNVNSDFSDIRIIGFTQTGDTIETPYLVEVSSGKTELNNVLIKILNKSQNDNGFYYTFEVLKNQLVNQIELGFGQSNFDWQINLEGSQNQNDWFTILSDYRILSIKNESTNYSFTKLVFPDANYRFYRICIKSWENPDLVSANINLFKVTGTEFRNYEQHKLDIETNKEKKHTIIDVKLRNSVPVVYVKVFASNSFDYYRNVTISYISDSINTDKGWKHNYVRLSSGTISSVDNPGFYFSGTIMKNLRIVINNADNQPLKVDSVVVKGYNHELVARFANNADYFLYYGNKQARKPNYDIERFKENIPENLQVIYPGDELELFKNQAEVKPSFFNKYWLWMVMIIVIIALGWFTLNMIQKDA